MKAVTYNAQYMSKLEIPRQASKNKEKLQTLDAIFEVGPGIPLEIKKNIKSLIRTLEPFESLAQEMAESPDPETRSAFLAILEQSGTLSEKFLTQFSEIAASLAKYVETVRFGTGATATLETLDRALNSAIVRMKNNGRILGERVGHEIVRYVVIILHQTNIDTQNENGFAVHQKKRVVRHTPEEEKKRREYVALSALGKAMVYPRQRPNPERKNTDDTYTFKEKVTLLRDIDFLPGTGFQTQIVLPSSSVLQKMLFVDLAVHVINNLDPLSIARFKMTFNGEEITGNISRLDGDINASGCRFLKMHDVLRVAGVANASYFIQDAIITTMFTAWERGILREMPYISAIQREESIDTTSAITLEESTGVIKSPPSTESNLQRNEVLKIITPPLTHQEKPRYIKGQREGVRNISWITVMRRFAQMGVTISYERHPKLTYNGETYIYVNKHDDGTDRHTKRLREALEKLKIPEKDFLRGI